MDGAVAGAVDEQGRPLGQGLGVPRSSRGTDSAPGVRAAAGLVAPYPRTGASSAGRCNNCLIGGQ